MILEIILGLATLIALLLIKIKYAQGYWQRVGIRVPPDLTFPKGNNPFFLTHSVDPPEHAANFCMRQYKWAKNDPQANKDGCYGVYGFGTNFLVVHSPDLV